MPRTARQAPGGLVYHVLNRAVGRMRLFGSAGDYDAFERVLEETPAVRPMRVLGWCLMPNHWHLVLWPRAEGDLAAFMQRLTITHARRWVEHKDMVGCGHVYQGRFKSFPIQQDAHLLAVLRYVERNPLRAKLVRRAEAWRWSSLRRRIEEKRGGAESLPGTGAAILVDPPVDLPRNWVDRVNRPESAAEIDALRLAVSRGRPFGGDAWVGRTVKRLGLESTLRPRGRPRKRPMGP